MFNFNFDFAVSCFSRANLLVHEGPNNQEILCLRDFRDSSLHGGVYDLRDIRLLDFW